MNKPIIPVNMGLLRPLGAVGREAAKPVFRPISNAYYFTVRVLFLFLALLSAAPVLAQTPPPAADTAQPVAQVPPEADTVAALHKLFTARRRRQGFVMLGTTAAGLGTASVFLNQPAPGRSSGFSLAINGAPLVAAMVGIITVPVVALEALTLGGWGRRREALAIEEFKAHRLSKKWLRKLKPRYFRPIPKRE